ncbi:MAG TPA: HYR domain-containing protein [Chitinophagales bacterium]|nr:HYR domain-containing protein [Chitinophagales bacterium]HRK28912.1 HYR domain-containing protein [Chitinophagales bacterium]
MKINIKIRPFEIGAMGWLWLLSIIFFVNQSTFAQLPGSTLTVTPTENINVSVSGAYTVPPYVVTYVLVNSGNMVVASNTTGTFAPQAAGAYTVYAVNHDGTYAAPIMWSTPIGCATLISRLVQVIDCINACSAGAISATINSANTAPPYAVDYVLVCNNSIQGGPNTTGTFTAPNPAPAGGCIVYAINYDGSAGTPVYAAGAGNSLSVSGNTCYTVIDRCVNVTQDNQPPALTCPGTQTLILNASCAATLSSYSAQSSSDNCSTSVVTQSPVSGTPVSGVGSTIVTLTATDGAGNTATCSFTVNRVDNTLPTVTCPSNIVQPASVATWTPPTGSDNCGINSVVGSANPGASFPFGVNTVTYTVTDAGGNTATCSFTVQVTDASPPTITCPTVAPVVASAGNCGAIVTWAPPVANDDTGIPTVSGTATSGSSFPVGTTVVTFTATDGAGNTATCSFNVVVLDQQAPSIVCPAPIVTTNLANTCSQFVTWASPLASDNCPGVINLTVSAPASQGTGFGFGLFGVGTNTVVYTATDASNNTATCSFTITVTDTQLPVITNCPIGAIVNNTAGLCGANVNWIAPTASDNCPGVTLTATNAPGSFFGAGTTTVVYTATDAANNTATCSFNITVNDTQAPNVVCPNNIVTGNTAGLCSATVTWAAPLASDNCPGFITLSPSVPSGSSFNVGTTTVTITASDVAGNSATCSFTVTVNDTQAPSIVCPTPINTTTTGACTATVTWAAPLVSDNCPGFTAVSVTNPSGSAFAVGTTTVVYTATDVSNNSATCSFTVTVTDNQAPAITCPTVAPVNAGVGLCSAFVSIPVPNATDNCGITGLTNSQTGTNNAGGTYAVGTTLVTYTATDASGNTATCSFNVTVTDNQPPVITCPNSVTVPAALGVCTANVTILVPFTNDNCGVLGVVNTKTGTNNASGSYILGTTTVTYTVIDNAANTATCSFTVTVNDTQAPTITCPSVSATPAAAGLCSANVTIPIPTTNDNCSVALVVNNKTGTNNASGVYNLGTTTVVYTVTDGSGNTASCSFNVTVTDTQAPVITCPAPVTTNTLSGSCAALVTIPLATATDNCSVVSITNNQTGLPSASGIYNLGVTTVIYTATDGSGNTGTCSFTVTVNDTQAPAITCPSSISLPANPGSCNRVVTWTVPTATDNCSITSVNSSLPSGSTFSVGSTTVTYTATDGSSNTATCSFVVNITDTQAPTVSCPANITQAAAAGTCSAVVNWAAPTGADNCGLSGITTSIPSGSSFNVGTTTVVATATDVNGNTATCSFTVTITDSTPPSITCPANITQPATAGQCSAAVTWANPTATDNCGTPTLSSSLASGSTFGVGTTTVVYTATDGGGNTTTCSFTVSVADTQAPIIANCPANIVTCQGSASWTPPTATDNCGTVFLTSNFAPGAVFGAGTTTVVYTATDGAGNTANCSFTVSAGQLVVTATTSNYNGFGVSCFGGNNGSITVNVVGGTAPFIYNWSNGTSGTGNTISGLTGGTYSVIVTDANGCTASRIVPLPQPTPLNCSATVTNVTCNGANNGAVTTNVSGGVAPYSYAWSGPGGPYGNTGSITDLGGGTYTVTITDANGCVCINTVTVAEPQAVTSLIGSNNVNEGIGGIVPTFYNINTITFSGGAAPYNYNWSISGYVQYSVLAPGTIQVIYADNASWCVTITDSNGCGAETLVFCSNPTGSNPGILNIVNSNITSDTGGSNGTITLTVSGGTTCPGGGYNYQWAGPSTWGGAATATTGNLTGLPSGWYIVTVTDCSNPAQQTIGYFWVPKATRGRGKSVFTDNLMQVNPNPFVHTTTVQFSWPQDDQLKLEVYDIAGRVVANLYNDKVTADKVYTFEFDALNLPAGMYICRLVNPEGIAIQTKAVHLQSR